jgi:hypothetical protein
VVAVLNSALFGVNCLQFLRKPNDLRQLSPRLAWLYSLVHAVAVAGMHAPVLLVGSAQRWWWSAGFPVSEALLLSTLFLPLLGVVAWMTFVHLSGPVTHRLVLLAGVAVAYGVVAGGVPASVQALSCFIPPTAFLLAGAYGARTNDVAAAAWAYAGHSAHARSASPSCFVFCAATLIADAAATPGGFRWAHVVATVPGSRVKITLGTIVVLVILECVACMWLFWWRMAHATNRRAQGSRRWCFVPFRRYVSPTHTSPRRCSSSSRAVLQ